MQEELGVPLNWTQDSWLSNNLLYEVTGDDTRAAGMEDIEYLLENGVTVALAYGDRDYRCPWTGAEQLSLHANWTGHEAFRNAGYQDLETNATYNGSVVRQHGNLSFSRVFEAGHDCKSAWIYQALHISDKNSHRSKVSTNSPSYFTPKLKCADINQRHCFEFLIEPCSTWISPPVNSQSCSALSEC